MNVVPREKLVNLKSKPKLRNELVRKDSSLGIRGTSLLPTFTARACNAPRYQFDGGAPSTSKKSGVRTAMGPPIGPPRSAKRKATETSSSRLESSSSGRAQPAILASDSAAPDSLCTPKNRHTALRYISSSSKGGHSGTRSARSTSTSVVEASVILAISEGRGMARGEIGMAAVDLRHPHLVLCQFSDSLLYTHTLTKINLYNPIEIIVPHTFCEGVQPSQLYQLIRNQFPLVNLTTVQRRHFNDAAGRQQIQTLCAPQYSAVCLQVLHKFYALTAAAAVLKYVEYIQCIVFARESLKIEYHSSENTMIIDVGTATQLELVQPLVQSAGSTCCLLGILGPTYTIGGIRSLRAAILQPSCNREFIKNRQEAVQDLIDNDSGLMASLQDVIKKLSEIDKILFLCVESANQGTEKQGEAQLNQTILLKTTMDVVPKLVEALATAQSGRLMKIKMDLENPHYKEIADRIRVIIQDDAHLEKGAMGSLQRCFAVKPNINGLLDVARRTYSELIEDIQKIVEQLGETYDLPLRLNSNVMKGFHIAMSIAPKNRRSFNVEDLPSIFIQVNYNGASVTMTTEELVVLDQQAKESLNEIQKMSNIVISEMLKELRPFMSSLYKLCENVAELDILMAFAQSSSIGSYIRPEFGGYLDIRNSVHPLLDYNCQVTPVANDIYATPEYNFTIITGPNMGGKSIYIKQIALMQIMAQLGCFIPATSAVLRLCDRIFSRIGFNDSVELNASTFVVEMKEMQHIMSGLTSSSLVIIDELCRGTNTEEGTSIAWAICEELLNSEAFTFFTTHFMYLTRLQDLYFNVVNRHMAVTEEIESSDDSESPQTKLIYQHKLELGPTKIEHYGLALAAKTNLPEATVKMAKEFAELIAKERSPQGITTPERKDEELLYKLNADIRQESRKHLDANETIQKILQNFKEENPELINRLRCKRGTRHNRTDSSANYSSVSNSRPSFDEDISRQTVQTLMPKIIETMRADHRPKVICSASDDVENEQSVDSCGNEDNSRRIFSNKSQSQVSQKFKNPMLNKKPTVIYSTSEDEINANNSRKTTSVRSSNELLVSAMNIAHDKSVEDTRNRPRQEVTHDNHMPWQDTNFNMNRKPFIPDSIDDSAESTGNGDMKLKSNVAHSFDDSKNENQSDSMNNSIVDINNNTKNDSNSSQSQCDSDIADALTQIIEELPMEVMEIDSSSDDSGTCSRMSVNEELMLETINEINEELQNGYISIENIILTPPMGFRD